MTTYTLPSGTTNLSRPVSWIHIGDTHITGPGDSSELALGQIVDEINDVYAPAGVDFVFLPGDIADNGSASAYRAARAHLDRLKVPWYAIVGDHDVHERSFANFQTYVFSTLHGAFTIGNYRFLRLNAFSEPRPDAFSVDAQQLRWLDEQLEQASARGMQAVLLLHCYPSDLKQGSAELSELLRRSPVLLIDMGHTHYNEISNDGDVLYCATRSTGQIEEGPVGYSVITIDRAVVSWNFVRLGSPALVAITHPADHRLLTTRTAAAPFSQRMAVSAKIWSPSPVKTARVLLRNKEVPLYPRDEVSWEGVVDTLGIPEGVHRLLVTAQNSTGTQLASDIWISLGDRLERDHSPIDQENAIGAWPERDILGTQLGPNKNGRKW
ncbi:MAG: metallophosphoesterase [Acidobacteriaceae bacterium]|nr:metallophosphoesterase [Acidobacteriaceae bacterium]